MKVENLNIRTFKLINKPVHTLADMKAICRRGVSPVLHQGKITGWQMRKTGEMVSDFGLPDHDGGQGAQEKPGAKLEMKTEEIKKLQEEIDRRTKAEQEAEKLICQGRMEEAANVLDGID